MCLLFLFSHHLFHGSKEVLFDDGNVRSGVWLRGVVRADEFLLLAAGQAAQVEQLEHGLGVALGEDDLVGLDEARAGRGEP